MSGRLDVFGQRVSNENTGDPNALRSVSRYFPNAAEIKSATIEKRMLANAARSAPMRPTSVRYELNAITEPKTAK